MLNISSITIRVAGRVLIGQGSAVIHEGHKVALIGRNGTGKSTLLKAIAGEIGIDSGSIDLPSRYSMGMTRQEAPSGSQNLLDTVLATDLERVKLMKAAEDATDPQEIADIHERLEIIGASSAPSRAARILAGLGFGEEAQNRPCDSFSGGWRMRVALASLLFTQPDLLLLDEPTNHLDLEATMWLEDYLRRYPGTIIIVSHDRGLLNRVPEQIIHLNNQSLTSYKGNFDRFQKTRAERLELDAKSATKQEKKRQHLQSFVDRFRAKASKATQAQSRLKMLEKMTPIAVEHDEMAPSLSFADPGSLAPPMYSLENVSLGYGETVILKNVGLRLDPEDRVALLGANGNGKSTLMKMFAGRLPIMDGTIHRDSKIRVGYFAQHQADELPMGLTPIEAMLEREPKLAPPQARGHLGSFGFSGDRATTKISDLSGGEKARLLFAFMNREKPHILLLDEPTNHLDIETREALVNAANSFKGAVVIVSHDPEMIGLIADRLWLVADGTVRNFEGDLEDYRKLLMETSGVKNNAKSSAKAAAKNPDGSEMTPQQAKERRRAAADIRKKLAPFRKAVSVVEKEIEKFNLKKSMLEGKMAAPGFYDASNSAAVTQAQIDMGEIDKSIEALEVKWMEAQEVHDQKEQELNSAG